MKKMRLLDYLAVVGLILGTAYFFVHTDWFIRPVGMNPVSIVGREYSFVRETPYGGVEGETWSEIVRTDGSGLECDSGRWAPNYYQDASADGNRITQELGDWAWPCVDPGRPFYMRTLRRVILLGFLPLRPLETETNFNVVPAPAPIVPLPPPPALVAPSAP